MLTYMWHYERCYFDDTMICRRVLSLGTRRNPRSRFESVLSKLGLNVWIQSLQTNVCISPSLLILWTSKNIPIVCFYRMNASYHLKIDSHCLVIAHKKRLSERSGWTRRYKPNKVKLSVQSYIWSTITERFTCRKFKQIWRNPWKRLSEITRPNWEVFERSWNMCCMIFSRINNSGS